MEPPAGHGKPRAEDDDGHVRVEMEPDRWVSWFDRNRWEPGRGYTTAQLTGKWASLRGLRPVAPHYFDVYA